MLVALCGLFCLALPVGAQAGYGIIDSLSLAPFVPLVLDAFMFVAMTGYEFFVGNGTGIIYLLVWGWLAFTIAMYLVKLYFPKNWLEFFGMSPSGDLWGGKTTAMNIGMDLLKPMIRAVVAVTLLLPLKPQYITNFVVDPFLQFGAIYTSSISETVVQANSWGGTPPKMECPAEIIERGYISERSCLFLVQPVADVTHANNIVIKRGLELFMQGLGGLITLIPRGGRDFMNLITGAILTVTFVASNFFMALLIIQGIFGLGIALILYPFKVLMFVVKKPDGDMWFDPWDPFSDLIKALKALVITMIATMFIMAVNIAAIKALFKWDTSVFMVAAGGAAHSNVPVVASGASADMGFGTHSITWLSAILTFYLMFRIFELTREKLNQYTAENKTTIGGQSLYKAVTGDAKTTLKNTKKWGGNVVKATNWGKNTKLGKWVGGKLTGGK
ncbi:MAG: hypothetical protein FWE52_02760 [Alphaproteobacteria bacterium]|nr:hypothetical protein [Alphaproteobacteria bacterium]